MQRSQHNNALECKFCINLGVDWKPLEEYRFSWRSRPATPSIDPCGCFFQRRLTKDSGRSDHCWNFRSETDSDFVGKDVVETLSQFGLPWLAACCDVECQMDVFGPGYEFKRDELIKFLDSRKQKNS